MKKILFSVIIIMFFAISCSKDDDEGFMSNATILGPDYRKCMCCGGWFVKIDTATWRFYDLPSNSGFNLDTATFPLSVQLDWKKKDSACLSDEIIVLKIKKK
jgi:hypothetical protein